MREILESQVAGEYETGGMASDLDIDAIMTGIRHNRGSSDTGDWYTPSQYADLEEITCPDEPMSDEHNPLLYFHLRQVNQSYMKFLLELDLRPSGLDQWPVVSSVWNRLRRHFHSLCIYHVNRVTEPLIALLRHIASILNVLVRRDRQRDAELNELEQRVVELETRLAQLEGRN